MVSGRALHLRSNDGAQIFLRIYDEAENTPGLFGEVTFSNEAERTYDGFALLSGNRISRHSTLEVHGRRQDGNQSEIDEATGAELSERLDSLLSGIEADGTV